MTESSVATPSTSTRLTPSYRLPWIIVLIGSGLIVLQPWIGIPVAVLGAFLLFQTRTIRLEFTTTELLVLRGEFILRRFPYRDWQTWTIYWPQVPILFYFREVNSIHFLPMLFSPTELVAQLNHHCPEAALLKTKD